MLEVEMYNIGFQHAALSAPPSHRLVQEEEEEEEEMEEEEEDEEEEPSPQAAPQSNPTHPIRPNSSLANSSSAVSNPESSFALIITPRFRRSSLSYLRHARNTTME
eukprot:222743-Pyramimonas_sp.AAC.1